MELILFPNDILTQQCAGVEKITKEIKDQCHAMMELMKEHKGLGLAAPQIGILNKVIVMDTTLVDSQNGYKGAIINPVIMKKSNVKREYTEKCLSFPDKEIKVKRPIEISLRFKDINNKMQYKTFKGLTAICLQHEYEHLQGIVFTKYEEKTH